MTQTTNYSNPSGPDNSNITTGVTTGASMPTPDINPGVEQRIEQNNDFGQSTNRLTYSNNFASAQTVTPFAAVPNVYQNVSDIDLVNTGASAVSVELKNSAGVVLWQEHVPANGVVNKEFATAIGGNSQMVAGTALSLVIAGTVTSLDVNLNGYMSVS